MTISREGGRGGGPLDRSAAAVVAAAMESTERSRKRQQVALASASPDIPDDVIRRILLRLPSRSVLRCRAVCKAWLQMASDPGFARVHHNLQPALPLVSFLRGAASSSSSTTTTNEEAGPFPVDRYVEAFDLRADEFRPTVRFIDTTSGGRCGGRFRIHGSCDGLLLLSFDDRFYVCNPATHQWTRLPDPLPSSWFAGFYRHEPTGEYRALFYRDGWTDDQWPGTDYYILVPDSRTGRGIGLPSEKGGYKFRGETLGPAVLLRGSLHWMPQYAQGHAILVFDTATEMVNVMYPPMRREHMSLVEVNGELAMFSCGNRVTMIELWLLEDYENEIWVCEHRVRLPEVEVSTFVLDESWRMFFMSEDGVVIVTPEQKLLHYGMNGTLRRSLPCNGCDLKITRYTLKESLIQHAFFKTQDNSGDRNDEAPPFFRVL